VCVAVGFAAPDPVARPGAPPADRWCAARSFGEGDAGEPCAPCTGRRARTGADGRGVRPGVVAPIDVVVGDEIVVVVGGVAVVVVATGVHDSVTPATPTFTGNGIALTGVPGGTSTVNDSFWPVTRVTVTTHGSALAPEAPASANAKPAMSDAAPAASRPRRETTRVTRDSVNLQALLCTSLISPCPVPGCSKHLPLPQTI
jgi:hypothetical protein